MEQFSPRQIGWLVAAIVRLKVEAPIRLAALGNMLFSEMSLRQREAAVIAFECNPVQFGLFRTHRHVLSDDDLAWLYRCVPAATSLARDERFLRALTLFEQSQWGPTLELAMVMLWSSIEVFFDVGGQQNKTQAICRALSDYVTTSRSERDRAYRIIAEVYSHRGRVVHAGRTIEPADFVRSLGLARVAFRRALLDDAIPSARQTD